MQMSNNNNQSNRQSDDAVLQNQVMGAGAGVLIGSLLLGPLGGLAGAWLGASCATPDEDK